MGTQLLLELMELNPMEESGRHQHFLEPLDLFEHCNRMLGFSLTIPLEAGLPINAAFVNSERGGTWFCNSPQAVLPFASPSLFVLPFLSCLTFSSSLISQKSRNTCSSHGRGRAGQDYIVCGKRCTGPPFGPMVFETREFHLCSKSEG